MDMFTYQKAMMLAEANRLETSHHVQIIIRFQLKYHNPSTHSPALLYHLFLYAI